MTLDNRFPVVGIGASAGGLQALQSLFQRVPDDTGLGFIVVTHLPRDRDSALPEILGRSSFLPVAAAVDGQFIQPDRVAICPPDHILTVKGGKIVLKPRASDSQLKPIDVFLSSLAEDLGEAAVGILLSGGGSDGALGIKGIKERGGLTLAQGGDGSGPQYPDMPETAIAAGVVDLVLAVEEMGPRLADYARNFGAIQASGDEPAPDQAKGYDAIYRILRDQVGHDFSGYKTRTFHRRVHRRMEVVQVKEVEDYVARLRGRQ